MTGAQPLGDGFRRSEFQVCPLIQSWHEGHRSDQDWSQEGCQACSVTLAPKIKGPSGEARAHVLLTEHIKLFSKYLYLFLYKDLKILLTLSQTGLLLQGVAAYNKTFNYRHLTLSGTSISTTPPPYPYLRPREDEVERIHRPEDGEAHCDTRLLLTHNDCTQELTQFLQVTCARP